MFQLSIPTIVGRRATGEKKDRSDVRKYGLLYV